MTEYNIVKAINTSVNNEFLGQERFYVCFVDGPQVGLRENIVGYETEAKAKRRIRDLKRKEENETTRINVIRKSIEADLAMIDVDKSLNNPFIGNGGGLSQPLPIIRQVGCYPYLKKSQYRR